ncbi:MAG TPA: hypothetical protein VM686_26490 [Polyangiaceae bacterium]|nr:hypothetical protein [Polyangiaceae bacterium]
MASTLEVQPGPPPSAADPASFHALLERRECSQLFILCCGQANRLMLHPLTFIRDTRLVDRNVLIIRDPAQGCYQRGVGGGLPDIPSLVGWLRQFIVDRPHLRKIYCVGSSGGAYMAMIAGHLLKADAVWAFAPAVELGSDGELDYVDPRFADLARVLGEGNGVTRHRVYYNESHEPDRVACGKLRETPNVQLLPQGGEGHGVIIHLAETNRLGSLFPAREVA